MSGLEKKSLWTDSGCDGIECHVHRKHTAVSWVKYTCFAEPTTHVDFFPKRPCGTQGLVPLILKDNNNNSHCNKRSLKVVQAF